MEVGNKDYVFGCSGLTGTLHSRPHQEGKIWAPDQADAHEWTAITAPCLLAVQLVLCWAIREEQKPLMPHKIWGLVLAVQAASPPRRCAAAPPGARPLP